VLLLALLLALVLAALLLAALCGGLSHQNAVSLLSWLRDDCPMSI
jgi:hypothetical protein